MDDVDVIVIGAGPAGEASAGRCAAGGLDVVVVEGELVGGECSYWGCIPSKTLIRPGDVLAAARRAPGASQAVTAGVDAAAAFAQRDYMTSNWDDTGAARWLTDNAMTLVRGAGRLTGERTVRVDLSDGGSRELRARRAVILATGTRPAIPPVDGLREITVWDNRGATAATHVPRRLLVLGGGFIGAEMAQAFRRLGSEEVTVVESSPRLLAREEAFAGDEVRAAFEAEGMNVVTGVAITGVRRDAPDGPVTASLADGRSLTGDEILVCVGRRPKTTDIGLETVGLPAGGYVDVDDRLRVAGVAGEWLFAVGDCNGRALFTHMGKYHGRIAGDVILGRPVRRGATDVVPRVTFTDPQVCAVGHTEAQAREAGVNVRTVSASIGDVPGAYVQGNGVNGTGKLVVDADRDVIVGATFTGPSVQELLHSATVAIVAEVPMDQLSHAVPSFPTVSEVWISLLAAYETAPTT